jgi:hypothetical protein
LALALLLPISLQPGSGFTDRIISIYGNLAEDQTVSSIGSYAATANNSSGNWVMQMATFKAKP